MDMRGWSACLAVVLVTALAISCWPWGVSAQGEGSMTIETRAVLTSVGEFEGSGKVKITLTEGYAAALRMSVYEKYDENSDSLLSIEETRVFLVDFSESLFGRAFWGTAIDRVTDFANISDDDVRAMARGIVHTALDSTYPATLLLDIEGSGRGGTKLVQLSVCPMETFADALSDVSGYEHLGPVTIKSRSVIIGVGSFTNPSVSSGKLTELRTPVGHVLWYTLHTEVLADEEFVDETMTYEKFTVLENQQIAFFLVLIGAFLVVRLPAKRFEKYKMLHPRKFRKFAKQLPAAVYSGYVIAAVMVVLYLLPFLFSGGSGFLLYSFYLFFIVPGLVVVQLFVAKTLYDRATLDIPEDNVIPVKQAVIAQEAGPGELCQICFKPLEEGRNLFRCSCRLGLHADCAEKAQTCPSCGAILFPERTRSIECKKCGESFVYTGMDNDYSIQCTRCGAFQEEVQAGRNYMVVDHDGRMAYSMARAMGISERPVMVMTTNFPGKVREENDLGDNVEVKWFSDSSTDIDNVNPRDLDGDAMDIASTFLMTTKRSGLLVDGIEGLIKDNGFDKVLAFIRRLNDLAVIHGSTIILAADKTKLPEEQFKQVSDEFDEVHDYQ